ncbi:beta-N-acetylhexosaminidase [Oerskovia merdavium]|uniref:beta-N-acetylhexosaminidase n=1 Tax=Oerskovia merdavium TaxID=2762227 RepID=A0ABR8TY96_9CELL|nr:family 20 glycosylhydrolase [Oerskovia merdavium]MBD7980763.1 beta-N-acetylhexosaminidase [Oerskovia merdavium]
MSIEGVLMNSPRRRRPVALTTGIALAVLTASLVAGCTPEEKDASAGLGLVPVPTDVRVGGGGAFVLDADSTIALVTPEVMAPDVHHVGEELAEHLGTATGFDLPLGPAVDGAVGEIRLELVPDTEVVWERDGLLDDTGVDAYELTVDDEQIVLTATSPPGLFRGVQTLRQLFPPELEATTVQEAPAGGWTAPAVTISDEPRFAYRGAMLDVARRFYPVESVKRFIDHASTYKLNALHLHLTDDQGWRIAVDALPGLTEVGSTTQEGWEPGTGDGERWYYTADEYAEIVAYARDKYMTVVPEIDGPGHTLAAQASLGSLTCDGVATPLYWGPEVNNPIVCASDENMGDVRAYLQTVLASVAGQNPGPYLHLGGDEAPSPPGWYQSYAEAANEIATGHGKTVIGWHQWGASEELPPGALIQYWGVGERLRGVIGGEAKNADLVDVQAALDKGARLIMSPADRTYLDMKYDEDTPYGLEWASRITLEEAYDWDPATELTSPDGKSTLADESDMAGVEVLLWSDRSYPDSLAGLPTSTDVFVPVDTYADFMLFPRLPATAEVAWSEQADRSYADFRDRVVQVSPRWTAAGIGWNQVADVDWVP